MEHSPSTPDAKALTSLIHRIEQGVGALNDEVIELQKRAALGAVAGLLAHEVNNILTPVLAYVRLARLESATDEAIQRALAEAESGVTRTTEIASAILSLGRSGADSTASHANIRDAVRQAAAALGRDLSRDHISCEIRVPEHLAAQIGPTSLQQILVNLLQNARAAILSSRRGGGQIEIVGSTWNTDRVRLEVADSGPGIPADHRHGVFEPFVRGATGTPGTGLGLTVCRELVNNARGSIHVEGNPGGGARFVIELPLAADESSHAERAA